MTKPQKKITNPMTIIAIFAALSETSAAVSLPFLDNQERQTYIWFLISFPFYLLFLFFITLNFNYKSLYAPSDFQKSKQFIKVIDDSARPEKSKKTSINAPVEKDNQPNSIKRDKPDYLLQSTQDPPAYITFIANQSTQYQVPLPASIHGIRIIDARWIRKKKDLGNLMTAIPLKKHSHSETIVFLTSCESEHLVNEKALKKSDAKTIEPTQSFYMTYNLSTLAMTVVSQH
ncbi:hypothetical protein BK659_11200 [Pseudomonas brassicacearum]|uniref:Uncharacterized protein n=1 Tax=Pseudomonas brassicacearum TaxID=930166 RepID=A0A423H8G1_9PSED|nr:hypothetical protein [Pseudomonas brassicacearum]RON09483.1 hypothetical protein BK659_11200 [Pseudomonas brassicacearum]